MDKAAQKQAAKHFAEVWKGKGYEKGESQKFWIQLLGEVLGVEHPTEFVTFEQQVKLDNTSFIDVMIPETHVLIEQKSVHRSLDEKIKQSDGTSLTPKQQVQRYSAALPYSQRPRWIVTCNFQEFRVYDMEHPQDDPSIILLKDLPTEYYRLQFLVNIQSDSLKKETEVSVEAGKLVGKLYAALLAQYHEPESKESQQSLNKLCVCIVFCLYAEDSGLFGSRTAFHDYLNSFKPKNLRIALKNLFKVLDTPIEKRDPYMDDDLSSFPYVNGGLFADEDIEIPNFTEEIQRLILHDGSEDFDWSCISPTIFGACFESTVNPETRRAGGMHYTSIQNIHKVIDCLFLDELREEFATIKAMKTAKTKKRRLEEFQNKLASLRFFDPACGSGNFLTESYISLRRLENEILKELLGTQIIMGGIANPIKVSIQQFYGIELNGFAVTVAKSALWIAESQMMDETLEIIHFTGDFLPLKTYANIHEGNALRMDWKSVIPKERLSYIFGNPPFVGYAYQSASQKEDLKLSTGLSAKNLDYVSAWYFKAADYMQGTDIETAFVSTNSITQGEQVASTWKPLIEKHSVHIRFAHRPFRWNSESNEKAHVHCVIIGFETNKKSQPCQLFSGNQAQVVENISPYLVASPTVFIEKRNHPICPDAPPMVRGSQPTDDGNLVLTQDERNALTETEPQAEKFFRPFMMGKDFIDRKPRYCLWLVDANPAEVKKCPQVLKRIEAVRKFRLASKKAATRKKADTPMLFDEIKECRTNYIALPKVSSEQRRYIPMDYLHADVIAGDMLFMIPEATLYHFGILMSNVHMSWMRAVCGRLEMRYRYSNSVVYNNFPWPSPDEKQRTIIKQTAQEILDARNLYPGSSLADLYDEILMPAALRKAHQHNDRAVMQAYGFPVKGFSETDCVAALMKMYQELSEQRAR